MLRRDFLAGFAASLMDGDGAVDSLIAEKVRSGNVAAAALLIRRNGKSFARAYGAAKEDMPFLIASITKPMTASGVMLLRDRGELKLDDPVQKFLPAFQGGDRSAVTIKHLLTHTSGLPDMLPENVELRKRHAPLSEFVDLTCRTPLLFQPGTKVKYQSMGILLASAVAEKITGQPFREFLRKEVFTPLAMKSTSLGLGGRPISAMAKCQVEEPSDWDWNSPYWRDLGAPWGGAHSTVGDIAAFLEAFSGTGAGPWKRETKQEMITIQTAGLNEKWGLGWMRDPARLGKGCSPNSFGHWGSTGTVAWHDPEKKLTMVLLTTKPADQSKAGLLGPVSDIVSGSR